MCVVILRVSSGAIPVFFFCWGTHCKHVHTCCGAKTQVFTNALYTCIMFGTLINASHNASVWGVYKRFCFDYRANRKNTQTSGILGFGHERALRVNGHTQHPRTKMLYLIYPTRLQSGIFCDPSQMINQWTKTLLLGMIDFFSTRNQSQSNLQ